MRCDGARGGGCEGCFGGHGNAFASRRNLNRSGVSERKGGSNWGVLRTCDVL